MFSFLRSWMSLPGRGIMAGRGRGKLGMPLQEGGMEAFLWHRAAIPKALLASGCAQSGAAVLLQRAGSMETPLLEAGMENGQHQHRPQAAPHSPVLERCRKEPQGFLLRGITSSENDSVHKKGMVVIHFRHLPAPL